MSVFRVTLTTRNPHTREPHFVNFECFSQSMDDLVARLNGGRLVAGHSLVTRKTDEDGVFEVIGRKPITIGVAGVAHIEIPTLRFVEFEEASHGQH